MYQQTLFIRPTKLFFKSYLEAIHEGFEGWRVDKRESLSDWEIAQNFDSHLKNLDKKIATPYKFNGLDLLYPPSMTFWLVIENNFIGSCNIRLSLCSNKFFTNFAGNIGIHIRPSYQNKGFGSNLLKSSLDICKFSGLDIVRMGCINKNIASQKIILKNGGILIKEEKGNMYSDYEDYKIFEIIL